MRPSLRSWIWRVPLDQEVDEELDLHIELRRQSLKPIDAPSLRRLTNLVIARRGESTGEADEERRDEQRELSLERERGDA